MIFTLPEIRNKPTVSMPTGGPRSEIVTNEIHACHSVQGSKEPSQPEEGFGDDCLSK